MCYRSLSSNCLEVSALTSVMFRSLISCMVPPWHGSGDQRTALSIDVHIDVFAHPAYVDAENIDTDCYADRLVRHCTPLHCCFSTCAIGESLTATVSVQQLIRLRAPFWSHQLQAVHATLSASFSAAQAVALISRVFGCRHAAAASAIQATCAWLAHMDHQMRLTRSPMQRQRHVITCCPVQFAVPQMHCLMCCPASDFD